MTPGARRAKAQRLQRRVAEDLSAALGLTIQAEPPTRPGRRPNGARYVAEGDVADLRIRRSGQSGDDVVLASPKALALVQLSKGVPLAIEVKNVEAWTLDAVFRRDTGGLAFLARALAQLHGRISGRRQPVVVFGKNRYPPLALLAYDPTDVGRLIEGGPWKSLMASPILWVPGVGTAVPWAAVLNMLSGWK